MDSRSRSSDAMAMFERDRWERVQPLLDRALELSGEQRASWLDSLRATDPEVAGDVDSLLSEEAAADGRGFLSDPRPPTISGDSCATSR